MNFKNISMLVFFALTFSLQAQSDFNYSFYPLPKYGRTDAIFVVDSVTQKSVLKTDTSARQANVIIEKTNDRFAVRTLGNVSETLYDMKVRYIGLLENGDMLYRAISDDKESLAVNPIKGTVVIVFQSCFEVPNSKTLTPEPEKKCNTITHYFGNIAPGNIK